ncbi:MAG: hypothetical protein E6Y39_02445 [Clostridium butyricum]|nr:hypothetical protein [Clostridium butyricum]
MFPRAAIADAEEIIMKSQEFKHVQNEFNKLIEWIKVIRDKIWLL